MEQDAVPSLSFSSLSDEEVRGLLARHRIGLTVEEARTVERLLGRPPTLVEAVMWGIQGSEHSSYKSSRRFLRSFPTEGKHVILGPKEDSGIVAITDGPAGKRWGIVISHESHNKPSQVVPFEGAATGVGGTVRDVACMGARVIGCMDLLRLGDLQSGDSRALAREVIRGIAGYGNPIGVPNLGGDMHFDSSYNQQCLVNAVAVGIVREDQVIHSYVPEEAGAVGYDIILIGKPTDRSGFGGAAFASLNLAEEKREQNTGAVQEPNPFLERHLLASTYALFDWLAQEGKLQQVSFKDLGAGGIVCATVEQVAERGFGAEIDLDRVHVSIADLPPEVIACAETQERFCWMCHPSLTERMLAHYNETWDLPSVAEGASARVIGKVTPDGMYRVRHRGTLVCDARSEDITLGLQYTRPTKLVEKKRTEPNIECKNGVIALSLGGGKKFSATIAELFKALLAHRNYASRSPAIVHYDKDVIGNTFVEAGEADASIIVPLREMHGYRQSDADPGWTVPEKDEWRGVALAGDGNPRYGRISAYWQGANAAAESMCNVAAAGATPRALTDCLNYGNPEVPEQLASLEEGVRGIADTARAIRFDQDCVPIISGNVSLYNAPGGKAIPPSAIVCCIGVLPDARRSASMALKKDSSELFLIGERRDECGGSAYYEILEESAGVPRDSLLGANLPKPSFEKLASDMRFLIDAVHAGHVLSAHDISDGGLLLALFEMALPHRKVGGTIGIETDIASLGENLRDDTLLFSQTPGFVVEVEKEKASALRALAQKKGVRLFPLGRATRDSSFIVRSGNQTLIHEPLSALRLIWEKGLADALYRS
jgi:phosphoribosylformylglycinamidine synthase